MVNKRNKFQGVLNIIRFNWHQYVLVVLLILVLLTLSLFASGVFRSFLILATLLASIATLISLTVSYYVYDYSDLYELNFIKNLNDDRVLNISAGFDETSDIILNKYPNIQLTRADFYDPDVHTEISIKRARSAYPADKNTMSVNTDSFPFRNQYFDRTI